MPDVPNAKLIIQGGPFDGCGISLVTGSTTLGRDSANDIVVEHPAVSRQHARIIAHVEGCRIEDLKSLNGTYVDGERVGSGPRTLLDGDRIQLWNDRGRYGVGVQDDTSLRRPADCDNTRGVRH